MNLFSDFYGSVLTMKDKEKKKRELIEWIILIAIVSIIYLGGWQTPVIGKLQQVVLSTGIISPDIVDEELEANYNFEIEDAEGGIIDFNEFQGKVVFLNFWATWCPPCRKEIPDLQAFHEQYGDRVVLLGIDWSEDREEVRSFLRRYGATYPNVIDKSGEFFVKYQLIGLPTSFWIDEQGVIRGMWLGSMSMDDMVAGFEKTTNVLER